MLGRGGYVFTVFTSKLQRECLKTRFSRCMLYRHAQCCDWYRLKPVFLGDIHCSCPMLKSDSEEEKNLVFSGSTV